MDFGELLDGGGFGEFGDNNGEGGEAGSNGQDLFMFGLNSQEMDELKQQKDSVIFLVDCHKTMHQMNPHNGADQQSNIEQVLRACLSFVKTKIITNENDKVGFILYGCGSKQPQWGGGEANEGDKTNVNSLNFKNIHVMYPLDIPDASLIKQLETKISTFSQDHGWFEADPDRNTDQNAGSTLAADPTQINSSSNPVGSSLAELANESVFSQSRMAGGMSDVGSNLTMLNQTPRSPLFEALWICHQEFKQVEKQSYAKRIFLFTDFDSAGSNQDYKLTIQRAKDLESLNVDIELFPMPNYSQMRPAFDIRKFYANIISFDEDEIDNGLIDVDAAQSRLFELMRRIRQKEFRKRTQGKCLFEISGSTKIGMSFFCPIVKAKKPTAKKVHATNNKPLQTTTKVVCEESGRALYANQMGTYYPFGGQKVRLDKNEMQKIRNFGLPGMKLMGFKDKSYLKIYHNIKHSYFVFPDEKKSSGSSQCSDALIKEMIKENKIAIVKFIPRENSSLRFCALVPQEESIDSQDGFQTPAGFQLIPIPYADDLRDNKSILSYAGFDVDKQNGIVDSLTKEEKHSAKILVKNLNIDFDSRNFENPTVQKFYSGLQALALQEDEPEHVDDLLEPDYDGLKKFDNVMNHFRSTFYDGDQEDPECAEKPKRGAAASSRGRGAGRGRANASTGGLKDRKIIDVGSSSSQASLASGAGRGRGRGGQGRNLGQIQEIKDDDDTEIKISNGPQSKKRKLNEDRSSQRSKSGNRTAKKSPEDGEEVPSFNSQKGNGKRVQAPREDLDKKFRAACEDGSIKNFKVAEIREFLSLKSLPDKGVKTFLISIVEEYFDN